MNLEDIPSTQDFDRSGLLKHVLAQLKISRDGDHGPAHWARVRLHGLKVGGVRGADVHTCATIQSCWDGDRLDLGRVGIKPHKDYLSEEGARLIARAYKMSRGLPAG
jgi:hypothetical protein